MTTKRFKLFHEAVIRADKHDDVWYAGYLWMDLTERQARIISDTLWIKTGSCVKADILNGWFILPNGLKFRICSLFTEACIKDMFSKLDKSGYLKVKEG